MPLQDAPNLPTAPLLPQCRGTLRLYTTADLLLQQAHAKPHATAAARQTHPHPTKPPTAKNGVLFRLFLVFLFAGRRRMASRFRPTSCEM